MLKMTGDVSASSTHVDSIKQQGLSFVSRNLTLWQHDEDEENATFVPPSNIIEANCQDDCHDRGECVKGTKIILYRVIEWSIINLM